MSRLSRISSVLFNHSKLARSQPSIFQSSRGLHSSCICMDTPDDALETSEEASIQEGKTYYDSVFVIGDVAEEPRPITRDGQVIGYKLKVVTKQAYRQMKTIHDAACYARRCFPFIENDLEVDQQVLIRGHLFSTVHSSEDSMIRNSTIRIASIHGISDSANMESEV